MTEHLTDDEFNAKAVAADPSPEKALYWLSYYAEDVGNAYGRMRHGDLHRKTVRAQQYDIAKSTVGNKPSNQDCMMYAERSAEYRKACDDYANACADYMRMNILKEAAVLKITVFQSKLKAGREGHLGRRQPDGDFPQ